MPAGSVAAKGGLSKLLRPPMGLQSTDIAAAAGWGVAAATGALWFVQPFDWLKKQLFEKPEQEK